MIQQGNPRRVFRWDFCIKPTNRANVNALQLRIRRGSRERKGTTVFSLACANTLHWRPPQKLLGSPHPKMRCNPARLAPLMGGTIRRNHHAILSTPCRRRRVTRVLFVFLTRHKRASSQLRKSRAPASAHETKAQGTDPSRHQRSRHRWWRRRHPRTRRRPLCCRLKRHRHRRPQIAVSQICSCPSANDQTQGTSKSRRHRMR